MLFVSLRKEKAAPTVRKIAGHAALLGAVVAVIIQSAVQMYARMVNAPVREPEILVQIQDLVVMVEHVKGLIRMDQEQEDASRLSRIVFPKVTSVDGPPDPEQTIQELVAGPWCATRRGIMECADRQDFSMFQIVLRSLIFHVAEHRRLGQVVLNQEGVIIVFQHTNLAQCLAQLVIFMKPIRLIPVSAGERN